MFARSFAAAALAALSFVAIERTAAAAETFPGLQVQTKDFSQSISKGDFGAGFQLYGRTTEKDYAKMCAASDPAARCSNLAGFAKTMCTTVWKIQQQTFCGKGATMGYTADGKAGADVTLFGKDFDLFDISGGAYAEPEGSAAYYGIYVLGKKIKGTTASQFSVDIPLAERTLVTAETTFMLGPVPIDVSAEATGKLGIELAMSAGTASIGGTARPYVGIDGVFSAGVGTAGASVGIYGDLLLVEVSTPATAKVQYFGDKRFSYEAGLDLQINTLDGAVGLYGKFMSYRKEWEIFSWNGLQWNFKLGSTAGSVQM